MHACMHACTGQQVVTNSRESVLKMIDCRTNQVVRVFADDKGARRCPSLPLVMKPARARVCVAFLPVQASSATL
jgi:hypothetical protein